MIMLNKKFFITASVVMTVAVIAFSALAVSNNRENKYTVIVDAGHGAPDGGAVGSMGTEEKDINLALAKKLEEVLLGKGFKVIMTRKTDDGIWDNEAASIREKKLSDMNKRMAIMKNSNADLFLSIHMNSFQDKTASGLRIFYDKEHPDFEELAVMIQDEISKITGAKTYAVKTADTRLFLMKSSPLPSVLIECGFISNPDEEKKLKSDEYQAEIAWAIAESVENYYKMLTNGRN